LLCVLAEKERYGSKLLNIYTVEEETQLEKKIKIIISNRRGEYFSNGFDLFYVEHGVIHKRTPPYSPQSNGVTKRKNCTLANLVNAMLDTIGLSKARWRRQYLLHFMS
jgi:transposase InsO family protein